MPVDALLQAVEEGNRYDECVSTAMKPEVARLLAAVSAERTALKEPTSTRHSAYLANARNSAMSETSWFIDRTVGGI